MTPTEAARGDDREYYYMLQRLEQEKRFDPFPATRPPLNLQWYELVWEEDGATKKIPM